MHAISRYARSHYGCSARIIASKLHCGVAHLLQGGRCVVFFLSSFFFFLFTAFNRCQGPGLHLTLVLPFSPKSYVGALVGRWETNSQMFSLLHTLIFFLHGESI